MSPEQMMGEELDQRTDIYSLGCVLYEMLAGKAPFDGPGGFSKRFTAGPPAAREIRKEVQPSLDHVLSKCLARNPGERFANAAEMGRELQLSQRTNDERDAAIDIHSASPGASDSRGAANTRTTSQKLRMPRSRVGLAGLAALLVILSASPAIGYFRRDEKSPNKMDPRRIAVLDFEDQSPNHVLGHIASGLTVSLIQELSSTVALQVVSRNTVKKFQDRSVGLDSLIDGLRVGTLVEGTVQQSDGRLRVTAQLVDGASQMQLESATIERPMGELFLVEDDLAHQVAQLLRRRIGTELRIRATIEGTKNAEARDLVFRADKLRDDAANASLTDSVESAEAISRLVAADSLLGVAESIDRNWIAPIIDRGWIALELSRIQGGGQRVRMLQQAKAHADRAVLRDSLNANALQLRGTVAYWQAARLGLGDRDFRTRMTSAETDLKRALAIDSSLASAWGALSLVNVARGDLAEADHDARTALAMDTYLTDAPLVLLTLYSANLMKGAMPDAWRWCQRGEHDYPGDLRFVECHLTLLAEDGSRPPNPTLAATLVHDANRIDPPARAKAIGRAYLPIYREMMAAAVYARAGDRDKARSIATTASGEAGDDRELKLDLLYEEAFVHLLLGERAQAIAQLSEYLSARPSLAGLVSRHARWRPLWDDSTFIRLVHQGAPVLK
jgi:TolB-like protein